MPAQTPSTQYLVSPDPLTPEERVRFGQVYNSMENEYFQGRTPTAQDRLVYNRTLQQAWRRGWAVVGKRYKQVNLDATTRTNPAVVDAMVRQQRGGSRAWLPWALLSVALVIGLWYAASTTGRADRNAGSSRTPTPGNATAVAGTPAPTAIAGFITVGQRTPTTLSPDNLKIGNRSFVVYQASVDKDRNWLVSANSNYASWLVGSVVNWTFALMLQTDPDANALLTQLRAPGTQVVLNIRNDEGIITTHTFRIEEVRTVGRTDTAVYDIRRLGITIIVRYDDSDQRLYLRGSELLGGTPVAGETAPPTTSTVNPFPTASAAPVPTGTRLP
jgi:hypothetical protein